MVAYLSAADKAPPFRHFCIGEAPEKGCKRWGLAQVDGYGNTRMKRRNGRERRRWCLAGIGVRSVYESLASPPVLP